MLFIQFNKINGNSIQNLLPESLILRDDLNYFTTILLELQKNIVQEWTHVLMSDEIK